MGERRICDHCHKNDAAMSYERKQDGKVTMEYYCLPCHEQLFVHISESKDAQEVSACPYCGTTVEQFRARKIVGCSYCYQTMYAEIADSIVKMQGDSCGHRGKRPPLSDEDEEIFAKMRFVDNAEKAACRAKMELRERFARQKNEIRKLIDFLANDKERQQEYKDKLDRMERRGIIEEEIVW